MSWQSRSVQVNLYQLMVYILALVLIFGGGTVLYVNHVQHQTQAYTDDQDHKWCDTLNLLSGSYKAQPPTSPLGQQLGADFEALRERFHCDAP